MRNRCPSPPLPPSPHGHGAAAAAAEVRRNCLRQAAAGVGARRLPTASTTCSPLAGSGRREPAAPLVGVPAGGHGARRLPSRRIRGGEGTAATAGHLRPWGARRLPSRWICRRGGRGHRRRCRFRWAGTTRERERKRERGRRERERERGRDVRAERRERDARWISQRTIEWIRTRGGCGSDGLGSKL